MYCISVTAQAAASDQPYLSIASLDCQNLNPSLPADVFNTTLQKLAHAVVTEVGSPDILALQGIFDESTLLKLSQAAGGAYLGLMQKGCTPNTGSVGLMFNTNTIYPGVDRQYDTEDPQFHKPACTLPNGVAFANPLFENPVLRADVTVLDNGSNITLFIADWRSLVAGAEQQAQAGVDLMTSIVDVVLPENLIVLGDFNLPEGSPALTSMEPALGVMNLSRSADPSVRYSVTARGRSQKFDHLFVSPGLANAVISSGFSHYNADFSAVSSRQNATTPLRVSDHDSPYVHLQPF